MSRSSEACNYLPLFKNGSLAIDNVEYLSPAGNNWEMAGILPRKFSIALLEKAFLGYNIDG